MRTVLMFDLPMETSQNRKNYRHFLKYIKSEGFVMLQKSVYTKFHVNRANLDVEKRRILTKVPMDGFISILSITEKQFQTIEHIIGSPKNKEINNTDRYIEL
ncbi:MAG: CRISPR-associated endonuclease Cas2 [Candidatus Izemoplasmatales bacterium]